MNFEVRDITSLSLETRRVTVDMHWEPNALFIWTKELNNRKCGKAEIVRRIEKHSAPNFWKHFDAVLDLEMEDKDVCARGFGRNITRKTVPGKVFIDVG
ncbi:hypothetical protein Tco_1192054 [Tanacetum coccineum]